MRALPGQNPVACHGILGRGLVLGGIPLIFSIMIFFLSFSLPSLAKKKKETEEAKSSSSIVVGSRLDNLSAEDKRKFEALSDDQQKAIRNGKIQKGFNEWMVELTLGRPYYATEHHPVFVDYEQVWLYAKPEIKNDVQEERIIDFQTNWPTLHRKTRTQKCLVGDFFVLWDRGVVDDIVSEKERKVFGSCTVETSEAFLPIVDGKPVEPK